VITAESVFGPVRRLQWPAGRLASGLSLDDTRVVDTSTGITCVLILLAGPREWYVSVFASALAASALIFSRLRDHHAFWTFLGTAVGTSALYNWESTDNHKYLLAYWCLAIALSTGTQDRRAFLSTSGRLLIGVSFTLAVLWKLRSPDFITGDFFRLMLFTDIRFSAVTSWVGGVPLSELRDFRPPWAEIETISDVQKFRARDMVLSARLDTVAVVMTWWTLVIEAFIALSFLLPDRSWLGRVRDVPLLVFAVSTYSVATVLGFGYLLLAMGVCQGRHALVRVAYLAVFVLMFLFQIPVFALSSRMSLAAELPAHLSGADTPAPKPKDTQ
jgi:hypothetical protein